MSSIHVQSGVVIDSGGRLQLIAPEVTFGNGFSVPDGRELDVDTMDPTPGSAS